MAVIEVTNAEQFDELLRANAKAAVMFTATWSGPGKLMSPVFTHLSGEYQDIVFASVDVDQVSPVAQKYSIRAMPTFVFFRDATKSDDMTGANKPELEDRVKKLAG
ncbi:thioredoxin family protein [Streptomyces mirabilis]|uniref:thioredoxin family protein n=1 Tax=Streptomyces mirabilis TaxID=68239 RepID=UPI00339F5212